MKLISSKTSLPNLIKNHWQIILIVALAIGIRLIGISDWSLWEDEETSIYFSHHVDKPFPATFPIFFLLLKGLYQITGVSIVGGRLLAGAMGVVSIWLIYLFCRKFFSKNIAILTVLFLAINLGHLFWSQSIRYYTTVLVFQILSIYFFLDGFENKKYHAIILSNLFLVFAILTHHSAALIVPAMFLYLLVMVVTKQSNGAYHLKGYLTYIIPLLIILSIFAIKFLRQIQFQGSLESGIIPSARDPIQFMARVVAYFGIPIMFLGSLNFFIKNNKLKRILIFSYVIALIPILELVVITMINKQMDLTVANWYYALISLVGFSILASNFLRSFYNKGYRILSILMGSSALIYYLFFLAMYFSSMHGGRERWMEATQYLKEVVDVDIHSNYNPEIYATAPGVVAYYLGINPAETMGHPMVSRAQFSPPPLNTNNDRWFLIKPNYINTEYAAYFKKYGVLKRRFDSKIGPFDQWSLLIYHCKGNNEKFLSEQTNKN